MPRTGTIEEAKIFSLTSRCAQLLYKLYGH